MKKGFFFFLAFLFELVLCIYFAAFRVIRMIRNRLRGKAIGLTVPMNLAGKHPVLLTHGLNMDDFCMRKIRRRLIQDDWGPVYILNLGHFSWTLAEHTQLMKKAVGEIFEKHGKMHVIAHSMGGLVARNYLYEEGASKKITKLVTVATPHAGTPVARFAWSTSGRQLIPHCDFISSVNRRERRLPKEVETIFLWGNLDWIVPPKWSGPLQHDCEFHRVYGDKFHFVKNHGHMSLLMTRTAYEIIHRFLKQGT